MGIPAALDGKLRLPLIGAPMFIVSRPALVIAQCTSGIIGSFPALNARPQQTLDWSAGQGAGGVNEILPASERVVRIEKEYDAARALFGTG